VTDVGTAVYSDPSVGADVGRPEIDLKYIIYAGEPKAKEGAYRVRNSLVRRRGSFDDGQAIEASS